MNIGNDSLSVDTEQDQTPATELEQTPAESSAPEQEATKTEPEGETTEPAKDEDDATEKEAPKKPWYERRIASQSAKIAEAIARTQELERQLAALSAGQAPSETQAAPLTPNDPVVLAAARQIAAQDAFNAECNAAFHAGTKAYADFSDAVSTVKMVDGYTPIVIEAALATGAPADVLYRLGKDPDEAERIFSLSPVRMAVELGKLASAPKAAPPKPPLSSAPPPIKPINSKAPVLEKDPDKMSDAEWLKWREDGLAARNKR